MSNNAVTPAKLSIPSAANAVRRERLFREIDHAGQAVWIAAPAGAGKTTAAASYIAAAKRPALWYRLDSEDADPAAFFHFMSLAAARAVPRRRLSLPLLTPEHLHDLAGFARCYFRTLFGSLPAGSLLVVDNCHMLDNVPVFQEIMREVLNEIPAGIKAIILSRTAPPPLLARLEANRNLHLLGWDDMRLTEEETGQLAGAHLDAETIRRLHARSGGWAAGVILLLRRPDDVSAEREGHDLQSHQAVFNYFAGEIFGNLADEARQLLIRTAFFPDFTADMAERACDYPDTANFLSVLCREHCFIERSGGKETSYRYHDLFRNFLRAQAGAQASACRQAAAGVLAGCGREAAAIPLLLENGDWQAVTGLILGQAPQLVVQGRWQTLAGWIDVLPAELREAVPWLTFWRGAAEFSIQPAAARAMIERAYGLFAANGDTLGQMLSAAAVIEANFLEWANFEILDKWIDILQSLGGIHAQYPSPEIEARVLTSMLMAIGHRRPVNAAQAIADRLESLLNGPIDSNQKGLTAAFSLWYTYWTGDFAQALRVHAIAGRLLEEGAMNPLNNILLRCMKGQGEIFLGDEPGASEIYVESEKIASRHNLNFAYGCYVMPIRIYHYLNFGDLASAERGMAEVEKKPFSGAINAAQHLYSKSWLAMLRGDARAACELARVACELADQSGSFVSQAWTKAARALAKAAAGEHAEARQYFNAAHAILEGQTSGLLPYHLRLVEAWLALRRGDSAACHAPLREAFPYAAAHGLASNLQWLPEMMSELCAEALREDIEPGYTQWLIRKRKLTAPEPGIESWPWPLKIYTLGVFDVLREGQRIEFSRKTPKKPIALLKALVAFGGHDVPESRLIDALWPDGEAAAESLTVNLHRLRKLLGDDDAIQVRGGRIGLNSDLCWVDAWAVEPLMECAKTSSAARRIDEVLQHSKRALVLYRGNFLADDLDETWMVPMRERLRMKFIQHLTDTSRLLCEQKQCEQVIASCMRGLDSDALVEAFYQGLMRCYHCQGRHSEGLAIYRRMKLTLSAVLGIAPSAESEALYRNLRSA